MVTGTMQFIGRRHSAVMVTIIIVLKLRKSQALIGFRHKNNLDTFREMCEKVSHSLRIEDIE